MTLEEVRRAVYDKKPAFGDVTRRLGDISCLDYFLAPFPDLLSPAPEVLRAVERVASRTLGPQAGRAAAESLLEKQWVNTADHHGLLHHPYFYTSALARSHPRARAKSGATVVLAFGNVSLGNDSFPRGFFFHDREGREERFFFKSLAERRMPIHSLAAVSREAFMKEYDRMMSVPLGISARNRLSGFLDVVRATDAAWDQTTYPAQMTILNDVLWRQLFGRDRGMLAYLEADEVAVERLLYLDQSMQTNIEKLLFDASWRNDFIDLFEGVPGSHGKGWGTHFFWYADPLRKTRRALKVLEGMLWTAEEDVRIELSPGALREYLLSHTLVPSTALLLLMLHGEDRLASAGGLSQVAYLRLMMEKWRELLSRRGLSHETPNPSIFIGDYVLFAIGKDIAHPSAAASLIDILLYGEAHGSMIDSALESTCMSDALLAMMPSLYRMLTKERIEVAYAPNIPTLSCAE